MSYSDRMQRSHLYSVHLAPRGYARMADQGMQIGQQYMSPFDLLIGVIGEAGSGKSMLIKGMFPGLELTNDDNGVNIRPLPLLDVDEHGFFRPHTYHVDIRFESAFTQMHVIADAIKRALKRGDRVIVEHFDLLYPVLGINAHLLIGVGEEIIITRPNIFGPEPDMISRIVFKSIKNRRNTASAELLVELCLRKMGVERYAHGDVRHGFILSFEEKPEINIEELQAKVDELISQNLPISYQDETHVNIGEYLHYCTGPRMQADSTGEIKKFALHKEILRDNITKRYLLVGIVGVEYNQDLGLMNHINLDY